MLQNVGSGVRNYALGLNYTQKKVQDTKVRPEAQSASNPLINQLSFMGAVNRQNIINFGSSDTASYRDFKKSAAKAGINTVLDIEDNIKEENLLGTGLNSRVYKFDDPTLDKWAIKEDKHAAPNSASDDTYQPVYDEFDGANMGQEIAKIGDRYHILKKIEGNSHSFDNWSDVINEAHEITHNDALSFSRQLAQIADFKQEAFDDYARQLVLLSKKGYKQDSINPNNLIIDKNKQKIQIIDFFKVADPSHINSRLDLSNALLDFALFSKIYDKLDEDEQADLEANARIIMEKCNIASRKYDLAQDEETYVDYLANVDKWFGFALVDKGGDYRTRYEKLKNIIPELAKG